MLNITLDAWNLITIPFIETHNYLENVSISTNFDRTLHPETLTINIRQRQQCFLAGNDWLKHQNCRSAKIRGNRS
jgi:hypothetical protein